MIRGRSVFTDLTRHRTRHDTTCPGRAPSPPRFGLGRDASFGYGIATLGRTRHGYASAGAIPSPSARPCPALRAEGGGAASPPARPWLPANASAPLQADAWNRGAPTWCASPPRIHASALRALPQLAGRPCPDVRPVLLVLNRFVRKCMPPRPDFPHPPRTTTRQRPRFYAARRSVAWAFALRGAPPSVTKAPPARTATRRRVLGCAEGLAVARPSPRPRTRQRSARSRPPHHPAFARSSPQKTACAAALPWLLVFPRPPLYCRALRLPHSLTVRGSPPRAVLRTGRRPQARPREVCVVGSLRPCAALAGGRARAGAPAPRCVRVRRVVAGAPAPLSASLRPPPSASAASLGRRCRSRQRGSPSFLAPRPPACQGRSRPPLSLACLRSLVRSPP